MCSVCALCTRSRARVCVVHSPAGACVLSALCVRRVRAVLRCVRACLLGAGCPVLGVRFASRCVAWRCVLTSVHVQLRVLLVSVLNVLASCVCSVDACGAALPSGERSLAFCAASPCRCGRCACLCVVLLLCAPSRSLCFTCAWRVALFVTSVRLCTGAAAAATGAAGCARGRGEWWRLSCMRVLCFVFVCLLVCLIGPPWAGVHYAAASAAGSRGGSAVHALGHCVCYVLSACSWRSLCFALCVRVMSGS